MNKILLIIKREYVSRVRNKAFILSTLLTPVVFALLIAGSVFFAVQGRSEHKVAVLDGNGFFKNNLKNTKEIIFEFPSDVDTGNYLAKGYTDILMIPDFSNNKKIDFTIRSKKSIGLVLREKIERRINDAIED